MIGRRQLLCALPLLMASPAGSQEPGRTYRVAVIAPSPDPVMQFRAFALPELEKRGFVEGRNLAVANYVGSSAGMPGLAADALAGRPDVVVASTINAVRAVMAASPTMPIVMAFIGEDPVAVGLAKSYARPGGRVTGLTIQGYLLDGKRFALLHEAFPSARRIAILAKRPPRHLDSIAEMRRVAQSLGLETEVYYADSAADYTDAFREMRAAGFEGVAIAAGPEYVSDASIIARYARDARLPTIGEEASMARDGLVIGYGPNRAVFRRRAADYVARILNGTPPGDLPIEEPSQFELVINLRAAGAMGLTVPRAVLLRADEVIE
jgi:putative ABC transport system substrate-binding protein